ncbi:Mn2+/Fe2+ NRAMP family transporter [Pseudacidovorax sp. 1753]|uniref:hypothetical protein n=1 Tax=Pseudacidovorax sp. 1753 TaxID=3156419 RepID=UPI003391C5F8
MTKPVSFEEGLSGVQSESVNVPSRHKATVEPLEDADDKRLRLHKELVTFYFAMFLAVLLVLSMVALSYALWHTSNDADKRWLQSCITAILGGLVGFFLKK